MKVSEMTNEQLDYWAAKAQWWQPHKDQLYFRKSRNTKARIIVNEKWRKRSCDVLYHPTTNWQQAGELIEKFDVAVWPTAEFFWDRGKYYAVADYRNWDEFSVIDESYADTQRRAICMAVITPVFGDEVNENE